MKGVRGGEGSKRVCECACDNLIEGRFVVENSSLCHLIDLTMLRVRDRGSEPFEASPVIDRGNARVARITGSVHSALMNLFSRRLNHRYVNVREYFHIGCLTSRKPFVSATNQFAVILNGVEERGIDRREIVLAG